MNTERLFVMHIPREAPFRVQLITDEQPQKKVKLP